MITLPYLLIGNPENRRIQLFQEALANRGHAPATVLAHRDLLAEPERLDDLDNRPYLVRIDSTGENAEVEERLLHLGYEAAADEGTWALSPKELAQRPVRFGEVLCPRQRHLGFVRYLQQLDRVVSQRDQWRLLNPPARIPELFDKRLTSRRYAERGIPIPPHLYGITTPDQLRTAMHERDWRSVFVKLASGSSASCLAVYRLPPDSSSGVVMTTLSRRDDGWFNSLRLVRYNDPAKVDRVLAFLLREGSHIEKSVPKVRLDGMVMDCRVLVIAGRAAFTVVRQSHHPITNLHLGGQRGDLNALWRAAGEGPMSRAMDSCSQVAQLHGCFQVGVDLLFEPGFQQHRIIESNAFGDLLPGLRRDGASVYETQIDRAPNWYAHSATDT